MSENAIDINNVSKTYRVYGKPRHWLEEKLSFGKVVRHTEVKAVHDITLSVSKGETLGIIGSNGAGKTTLLKLTSGLTRPTNGEISINGSVSSFLTLGSGFHPEFSGRDNISMNLALLGLSRKEINKLVDEIADFSEIGSYIDHPVRTYSSGMYMRLGFSVAQSVVPDILIVDEVMAVGDEYFMGKCLRRLNELKAQGVTLVIVSHDLSLIRTLAHRVALIEDGALFALGEPDEVSETYLRRVYDSAVERMKTLGGTDAREGEEPFLRRGSGEARVKNIRMLNASGEKSTSFRTGEKVTIAADYEAYQPVKRPLFGINIYRADGTLLVSTNHECCNQSMRDFLGRSDEAGEGISELKPGDKGEMVFEIDPLPLLKGQYSLSVSIFDGSVAVPMPIDEVFDCVRFDVHSQPFKDKGQFLLTGPWRFRRG